MTERKRKFFCPAKVRKEPTKKSVTTWGPIMSYVEEDFCWTELPCEEHGIETPAQGHAKYGQMITEILPGEPGYDDF